jgi:hypothetical protein
VGISSRWLSYPKKLWKHLGFLVSKKLEPVTAHPAVLHRKATRVGRELPPKDRRGRFVVPVKYPWGRLYLLNVYPYWLFWDYGNPTCLQINVNYLFPLLFPDKDWTDSYWAEVSKNLCLRFVNDMYKDETVKARIPRIEFHYADDRYRLSGGHNSTPTESELHLWWMHNKEFMKDTTHGR